MEDIEATGGIIGALKRRKPKRKKMKMNRLENTYLVTNLPWVIPSKLESIGYGSSWYSSGYSYSGRTADDTEKARVLIEKTYKGS